MTSLPLPSERPGLYVVTGAGRGFGRALTLAMAAEAAPGSRFVLIGRCSQALETVAKEIGQRSGNAVEARTACLDLGSADSAAIGAALGPAMSDPLPSNAFGVLVHNAGSLGEFGRCSDELDNKAVLDEHFSTNVTSVLLLNAYWLRLPISWWLVNVSSICALQPFRTLAVYCASKAARLMLFRTLAVERPDLTVLSYGPGPLDTDMQTQLRTDTQDETARAMWREMQARLLPAEQSAAVLLKLLRRGGYSGESQVDVFDVMDELLQAPPAAAAE